ncbi:RNA polymerase, sigma-24 subunit, ECF subfamily [Methyloglobulus morosus KoM1]|uniref:RNA polymerase, sigma-24 subunit, ECF subfamily n=1 Tax=Methyloglobulus morosus KoM1 TaxID=1116472 RepID=V5BW99_9GAMM|nr:RNA polymerase sigma factor [Methyloglobulus morosus]ESS72119.1 RNA polymerase, sigma-24 subunit, ECF subfamily [Methyloglobulus morosus KoM1]
MTKLDRNLLNTLFEAHSKEMLAFIRGRFPNEESADIVQEAFLRVLQYPNPETIREPRTFLFQTAANVAVDYYRRSKTRDRFSDYDADIESLENTQVTPEQQCETAERLQLFSGWLANLPELQRHAFVLFRMEGYSHKDIAEKLGISVRCSERYVQQALRYLVSCLDEIDHKQG